MTKQQGKTFALRDVLRTLRDIRIAQKGGGDYNRGWRQGLKYAADELKEQALRRHPKIEPMPAAPPRVDPPPAAE